MIESNLVAGAQKLVAGKQPVYGQSITDACINWEQTYPLLKQLAAAARARRTADHKSGAVRGSGAVSAPEKRSV